MKTNNLIVLFLLIFGIGTSQNGINYKALIKDANGNIMPLSTVDIEFTILENSNVVYKQLQNLSTDQNGIVITTIGTGSPILGDFNAINWSEGNHYLNVKVDTGSGFVDMGTTQFTHVPYALNSEKASNVALEIVEGDNGYRIAGRDPDFYGDLGLDAIDFSYSVLNDQDYGAIGTRSLAVGAQIIASGQESFATGSEATAFGDQSIAMGNKVVATGNTSVAMGKNTTASALNAFAVGQNTEALGESSSALGIYTNAEGKASVALGNATTASGEASIAVGDGTTASGNASSAIGNHVTARSFSETVIGSYNRDYTPNSATSWNANDHLFVVGNGTASASDRSNALTVLKNGKIGIETINPQTKLHITGGSDVSLANNNGYLLLGDTSDGNMVIDNNEIMAKNNGAVANLLLQIEGGDVLVGGEIRVNEVEDTGVAMRVNGDEALWYNGTYFSYGFGGEANYFADNIGIGTTTPDSRLQIVGGSDVQVDNGAGYLILGNTDGKNIALDENEIMARDNNGFSTLNLNINGGTVATGNNLRIGETELLAVSDIYLRTSTTFTPLGGTSPSLGSQQHQWWDVWAFFGFATTSDKRKKTNIQKLNYGLEDVMKLEPVSYNLKNHPNTPTKIGFIAQDLLEVLPEVVATKDTSPLTSRSKSKDASDTMAVYYSDIIPVLTRAIQEQQKIIESQNARINKLETLSNELAALKAEIAAIKKSL
ncbi:tail fiber domain-containing protein [Ichthyenterobacterium sp. W332]|uniref:Tail fiber domain-containing protein n=1 Tax=Microcosmobacter mediterraneus TaxID=3075607 RepID=A0ABU2YFY2_9FLAO|nr:tail fiber domain-containing protein [Ichthyenterobacterium sp. W332]MDT0557091.1 tail fiber domain-containing protein [Ichthyenterobacterium sp. W332]